MLTRKNGLRLVLLPAAAACAALLIAGCMGFPSVSSVVNSQAQQSSANASNQQADQSAQQQQSQPKSSGAVMAYKFQFNAFYGAMWNFGWFGYKDANYKPGQGTVWQITSSRGSKGPTTFERAFLKVTDDKSQWWRLRIQGEKKKEEVVYEFLVGSDTVVQKVRFKDPDSGEVQEFVPEKSDSQPAYAGTQPTREQIANSLVGTETVTVQAGAFTADHYKYTDPKSGYTGESWISKKVPGYMVKFSGKNPGNEMTSTGELVQIESGVTTTLGSF